METSIWNYPGTWVWLCITAVMVAGFVLFALALHRTLRRPPAEPNAPPPPSSSQPAAPGAPPAPTRPENRQTP